MFYLKMNHGVQLTHYLLLSIHPIKTYELGFNLLKKATECFKVLTIHLHDDQYKIFNDPK